MNISTSGQLTIMNPPSFNNISCIDWFKNTFAKLQCKEAIYTDKTKHISPSYSLYSAEEYIQIYRGRKGRMCAAKKSEPRSSVKPRERRDRRPRSVSVKYKKIEKSGDISHRCIGSHE